LSPTPAHLFLRMPQTIIRPLQPSDNAIIAKIIRNALAEFGAAKPGTVYFDPTTDDLFQLFQTEKSCYNIAELDGIIVGGGGIFPTEGLPTDTCELVKMYLAPEARGKGLGAKLVNTCLDQAATLGFKNVYLETMDELKDALKAYARLGFSYIDKPMGNSGHFGCSLWMIKKL
jgi:putative acetyltransferase